MTHTNKGNTMAVVIQNMTPPEISDDEPHLYQVRINKQNITTFYHLRKDGLATCLEKAADAVIAKEMKDFQDSLIALESGVTDE